MHAASPAARRSKRTMGSARSPQWRSLPSLVIPRRFSSSREAVRYAGMDITVHASDKRRAPGHLSRQGPPVLRWALYEDAQAATRASSPDRAYYQQTGANASCMLAEPERREEQRMISAPVWTAPEGLRRACTMAGYLRWLSSRPGVDTGSAYMDVWRWSVTDVNEFWRTVWDYFHVSDEPAPSHVLAREAMPGALWCPGRSLNYAQHLLRMSEEAPGPALICVSEDGSAQPVGWSELSARAGALAAHLRAIGVGPGDRVVGYLTNTVEPVVALIACASIGAIWSLCGPDYGTGAVIARFSQLAPTVLIAASMYRFGGQLRDSRGAVHEIAVALPSLREVIHVGEADTESARIPGTLTIAAWDEVIEPGETLEFASLPFSHPLWVLFSSGTTGIPKGVVHSHGGIVLEHLKALGIQSDIRPGDRYLLLASTSWMVWNYLIGSLLVGATAVLLDGSPVHPDLGHVWRVSDAVDATTVGMGAALLHACQKSDLRPRASVPLNALRSIGSTGSPLSPAGHRWVRAALGDHIWLNSASGGTEICSAFVGGCPLLPQREDRIQAPYLGVAVSAWDEQGREVLGRSGELVVTRPMPSMPLSLWGDVGDRRYHDTYFSTYPGVWRHGDFIEFDADGSSVIHGRSDSTLNRKGVRLGSADIYAAVEALPQVVEALVVGVELGSEDYYMPLFVELSQGIDVGAARDAIVAAIRRELSPRHVPDVIIDVPGIPHTKTGKKLEVPVKRLLQGASAALVADRSAVDRPELLDVIAERGLERLAALRG
jgi:acetoacetyl-CoA synthetase